MGDSSKSKLKQDWVPTESAFRNFLSWLGDGDDSRGERYLEMRRRLVCYFDRKQCFAADELADETLNRVARRLEEEGTITDAGPAQYCYLTAKFVFMEHLRKSRHEVSVGSDLSSVKLSNHTAATDPAARNLLECLESCLAKLFPLDRNLILEYYSGEKQEKIRRRKQLAEKLALTLNALSIRACRIRNQIETCVIKCSQEG